MTDQGQSADEDSDGSILVGALATEENYDEEAYLAANPDVRAVVDAKNIADGRTHFLAHGKFEGRQLRFSDRIRSPMIRKLEKVAPFFRGGMAFTRRGIKYDFLSPEFAALAGISATDLVSANSYDPYVLDLIGRNRGGLILDCGAGRRDRYFDNVVNYEIVDYDTTDILGIGEALPFADATFDAVISIAVLEHVKDPFRCASELSRVLKPGGELACSVPFLQPFHGYPHHYFNMSHMGLRSLFERDLTIERQFVAASILPIWSLNWIVQSWAAGLSPDVRREFLGLTLQDLMAPPASMLGRDFVQQLSDEKNLELASATYLFARKP